MSGKLVKVGKKLRGFGYYYFKGYKKTAAEAAVIH